MLNLVVSIKTSYCVAMKKFHIIKLLLCLALIWFWACERTSQEVGGVSRKQDSKVVAQVTTIPEPAYVQAVAPGGAGSGPDGEALFVQNCAACHQASGAGIPGAFPPLAKSPYVTSDNTERMASIMIYGLSGPIKVLGNDYSGVMAPLGHLKDQELAAIATYVRSAWGNSAEPVAAEVFTNARTKWGSRSMFTIQELGEES